MPPPLQIVVTCTKRKTQSIPAALKVRSLRKNTLPVRGAEWMERLSAAKGDRVAAGDIYCGDHWQMVKSLIPIAEASGHKANIWICSAGYGVLSLNCKILPYSATFATSHPDSVCRKVSGKLPEEAPQAWWRLLSEWEGPTPGMPRRLAEIPRLYPRSAIWIVASEIYLHAIANDVKALATLVHEQDRLSLFSAGTKSLPSLTEYLLPIDARLQGLAGGARRSLNIRLARHALLGLRKTGTEYSSLKKAFSRLLSAQPAIEIPARKRMTDHDVRRFIRTALRSGPHRAFTPLLRELRDQGFACESGRFASLFHDVQERIHES